MADASFRGSKFSSQKNPRANSPVQIYSTVIMQFLRNKNCVIPGKEKFRDPLDLDIKQWN